MLKPLRFILISIVGLSLALLLLWAGALGLADLAQMRGDAVVARYERGDPPSYVDWTAGYQAYRYATMMHPLSGAYRDRMGRLLELWAGSDERREISTADLQQQALGHFRTAARRRPTWPFSRIGIARLKAKLGQVDAEFMSNLRVASDLAPMTRSVQEPLLDLGLIAWNLLDEQTRESVLGIIDRNLLLNPRRTIQQAIAYQRTDLLEGRLDADPVLVRLYQGMLKSGSKR